MPRIPTKLSAKNIIAVASGKGGVGKSTIAANLALALRAQGADVVFLDADLYGPSVPTMFGISEKEKPQVREDGQTILPIEKYGLKLMSIGFLISFTDAVIWRGPLLTKMLQQFLEQVDWGRPDYMIIDLPPGTGDIHLSLTQLIPLSGVIIVTTPQDLALADVRRAVQMFEKTNVPLLGVVENMSYFRCTECDSKHEIFGGDSERRWPEVLGAELLSQLPLEMATRESGDRGQPIILADPQGEQALRFQELAKKVTTIQKEIKEKADALSLPSVSKVNSNLA